jgi:glycerophosphoryl diester phosphodiesterase
MTAQPLIIGHRGASADAPENTIAAFTRALRDGADGIEFDVRLARDGVPVVIHDATLQRTGLMNGVIAELSSSQLKTIDVGSWFNHAHPNGASAEYARETVPTLAQVFEVLAGTQALLYLEMKCDQKESEQLAAEVVKLIRKCSLADRVIVESFELSALETVKRIDAGIRTAALFEPRLNRPIALIRRMKIVDLARRRGADEIALHHALVTRRLLGRASQYSLETIVWTVDDLHWIQRARALGIKALITNSPAKMLVHRNASRPD